MTQTPAGDPRRHALPGRRDVRLRPRRRRDAAPRQAARRAQHRGRGVLATSTPRRSSQAVRDVRSRSCRSSRSPARACSARRERLGQPVVAEGFPDRALRARRLARQARHAGRDHPRRRASPPRAPCGWRCDGTVEALDGTVVELQPGHAVHPRRQPGQRRDGAGHPRRARARRHHDPSVLTMAPVGQYLRYSTVFDEQANLRVLALAAALAMPPSPTGVREIYPGYGSVYVEWDDAHAVQRRRATPGSTTRSRPPRRGAARPAEITVPVALRRPRHRRRGRGDRARPGRDRASCHAAVEYRVCARATVGQPMMAGHRRAPARPAPHDPANRRPRARGRDRQRAGDDLPGADAGRLERDRHRAGQRLRPAPRRAVRVRARRPRALRAARGRAAASRRTSAAAAARGAAASRRCAWRSRARSTCCSTAAASTRPTTGWRSPARSTPAPRAWPTRWRQPARDDADRVHAQRPDARSRCATSSSAPPAAGCSCTSTASRSARCTTLVRKGQRVALRPTGKGVRGYLALAGGIEAEPFLGSTSVDRYRADRPPAQARRRPRPRPRRPRPARDAGARAGGRPTTS